MPLYAATGVAHAWLVDPLVQTLEIFRLEAGKWMLAATFKGDSRVRAEPFAQLELDLAPLWRRRVVR